MHTGKSSSDVGHDPVMMRQVLDALFPTGKAVQTVIDCTLGRGGHAMEIARRLPPGGVLVGIDRDARNLEFASQRLRAAGVAARLFHANFAQLPEVLRQVGLERVDGMLADLGVSTNQLFDDRYGLSFQSDAPLDMRLSADDPLTAAEIVNRWGEKEIADLLYQLADERHSRSIARKIVAARAITPIKTTRQLADVVRSAVRHSARRGSTESIDPATRTFLALRMKTNLEVENLEAFLQTAPRRLAPDGRLAVIAFQSTEDRIVKNGFRSLAAEGGFQILTRKPLEPDDDEIHANARARSAKLRVVRRVDDHAGEAR